MCTLTKKNFWTRYCHQRRLQNLPKLQGHPLREPLSTSSCSSPPVSVNSEAADLQNPIAPNRWRMLGTRPTGSENGDVDLPQPRVFVHHSCSSLTNQSIQKPQRRSRPPEAAWPVSNLTQRKRET